MICYGGIQGCMLITNIYLQFDGSLENCGILQGPVLKSFVDGVHATRITELGTRTDLRFLHCITKLYF